MPDLAFTLTIDQKDLEKVHQQLHAIPFGTPRAVASAINHTLSHGRTLIQREIREELNLSQSRVLRTIRLKKAHVGSLSGVINVSRDPIKLIDYGARQTGDGVVVAVRKEKGQETIKGAFVATMQSGHTGVFKRVPDATHKKMKNLKTGKPQWHGLKIKELYGPTVVGVLANKPDLAKKINKEMDEKMEKNLESQVDRLLHEAK